MNAKRVIIYSPQNTTGELVEAMIGGCESGIEIAQATSTARLLELVRSLCPRLVIMLDIAPLIDGRNVAARIRESLPTSKFGHSKGRPAIYVITWQQSEQTILSLLEAGIDQYLTFPISIERLRHKVCEQLGRNGRHR